MTFPCRLQTSAIAVLLGKEFKEIFIIPLVGFGKMLISVRSPLTGSMETGGTTEIFTSVESNAPAVSVAVITTGKYSMIKGVPEKVADIVSKVNQEGKGSPLLSLAL